jgi:hypothetical protein
MALGARLILVSLFGIAGCGGSDAAAPNPFEGTLSISSALPAGATTCGATQTVAFSAAGASVHQLSVAGGDCVTFTSADSAGAHQPASFGTTSCPELNAPSALSAGQSFTTQPLSGPKTCIWQDLNNPPGGGGGGNPGY